MTNNKLLKIGIVGTVVAAVCCFTPVLVVLLAAVGLSAWLGGLDYVLFPALGVFILITLYAVYSRWTKTEAASASEAGETEGTQ